MPESQRQRLLSLWRKAVRCTAGADKHADVYTILWRAFNNSSAPSLGIEFRSASSKVLPEHNAPLDIRYPPDIRPRPLPGLIFSNIRPRSVTNWISTCGLNRFATCNLRSAECHRVTPTANLVCVISEVTGAQLVTAAQHTLRRVGSL